MKKLQEVMPIARSQMKLRVSIPEGKGYRNKLKELASSVESQNLENGNLQMVKIHVFKHIYLLKKNTWMYQCIIK